VRPVLEPPKNSTCSSRTLTWTRAIAQSDPGQLDEHYANAPLACLRSLLDSSYLGGA